MAKDNDMIYEFVGTGLPKGERAWGSKRHRAYYAQYPHLRKLSNLQLLEDVVLFEIYNERIKTEIGELQKDGKATSAAYRQHKAIKENLEQILMLKEKLGMFQDKDKLDAYQDIQDLQEKFKIWREENQGSCKVTCPYCTEIFFLTMRTENYDETKFPFFKDKILCNPYLHKVWKNEQINTKEYADILGVSPDYIDWLDEKHFQKKESEEKNPT